MRFESLSDAINADDVSGLSLFDPLMKGRAGSESYIDIKEKNAMEKPDHTNRCKGRTKQGKQCQAPATEGGLCFFHANPDKAAELGRVGGQKNRLWASSEHETLPVLDNAVAVRKTVGRLITEIYTGQLHPRIAAGLGPLLNLQLRAIELTNHEQRIAALERHAEPESKRDNGTADPSRDTEETKVNLEVSTEAYG